MKLVNALDGYREAEEGGGSAKTPQENVFMILVIKCKKWHFTMKNGWKRSVKRAHIVTETYLEMYALFITFFRCLRAQLYCR